ncbi:MAG: sn-glycerol-3-phosphate ABC transporter substrate-binding protein [Betaproteobacteria bacterium RIFCSPLOWO2_12_FULL_65_14]|nr:MAG: sn-glycerol-3-phosphate ABC transporter substrate-binding protein [Betaproteobacteria bacterium RIFCSPLOWO2_12_FULL_65_14]
MIKKTLFALGLLCAAALAHGAEEIRFWHAMSGPLGAELDKLVARFNASQKEYRVVPVFQGTYSEVLASALAARRKGKAPHVVQVYEVGTADMIQSGAGRPLWQVMQESGQSLDAKYVPAVSAYFSDANGRLLALPFNTSTPVLYYNRDAFRKAKLDPSKPPKTWYEMPKTLGALVEAGQSCAFTTTWPSWVLLENMSAWHNQEFATHNNGMGGTNARLSFNTRLMVRWISMLSSWQKSGYFTYAGRENQAEARFASGECAVLTSSSASYAELRRSAKFDFGVAQLPYYDDFQGAPQNTLIGGAGLWVLSGKPAAENKGAARFLSYLSKPDVQAEWHQQTGYVPITTAAYELTRKQGYYKANPGHEIAVRQLLLKNPTKDSKGIRLAEFPKIRVIIDEELETVWRGSKTPLEALNAAVKRGNSVLDKVKVAKAASR